MRKGGAAWSGRTTGLIFFSLLPVTTTPTMVQLPLNSHGFNNPGSQSMVELRLICHGARLLWLNHGTTTMAQPWYMNCGCTLVEPLLFNSSCDKMLYHSKFLYHGKLTMTVPWNNMFES